MVGMIAVVLVALHGGELHDSQSTGILALVGLAAVLLIVGALFLVRRNRSGERAP